MARKSETPIITHVEIYSRALRSIEDEMAAWEKRFEGKPGTEEDLKSVLDPLIPKLEALKTLYHIESGSEHS